MLKDRFGLMWFGTQDGLNKYDGFKFVVYKHLSTNPATLPANNITSICEDGDNIWVGTRLGGLSKFNRSQNSFTSFKYDSLNKQSISNNNVFVVYTDKKLNLWAGTEHGLNLFDKKTGKFKRFFNDKHDNSSLSDSKIFSIFEDDDQNLWVGTEKGLNLLNRDNGRCTRYLDKLESIKAGNNSINTISEDEQHNIWIGTSRGLNLLNKKNNTVSYYPIEPDKNSAGGINPIYYLTKTDGNKFWIASNTTLQFFDATKKRLIPIDDNTDGDSLMPNDGIYTLLEDKGILWIGTSSEGVSKYDRNLSIFQSYKSSFSKKPSAKNIIREYLRITKAIFTSLQMPVSNTLIA